MSDRDAATAGELADGRHPAALPDDAERREVNLSELAELLGCSENTLRKVVSRNPGFPVLRRGANGVAYSFDARRAAEWWHEHEAAAAREQHEQAEARAEELAQMRFDLLGGQVAEGAGEPLRLSGRERLEEYEAELKAIKLRRAKGELYTRDEIEPDVVAAFADLRIDLLATGDNLARILNLGPDDRRKVDDQLREALKRVARKLSDPQFYERDRAA